MVFRKTNHCASPPPRENSILLLPLKKLLGHTQLGWVLYILTRVCNPNSSSKYAFSMFFVQKAEKGQEARNLMQNLANKLFFKFALECWKIEMLLCKLEKLIFKEHFAPIFLLFFLFSAFLHKNIEKAYFDQQFAVPKCWLKYTTVGRLRPDTTKSTQ